MAATGHHIEDVMASCHSPGMLEVAIVIVSLAVPRTDHAIQGTGEKEIAT